MEDFRHVCSPAETALPYWVFRQYPSFSTRRYRRDHACCTPASSFGLRVRSCSLPLTGSASRSTDSEPPLVQHRRDKHAAKTFFRKLLKGCQYVPRVIITDKLKSYGVAKRELLMNS